MRFVNKILVSGFCLSSFAMQTTLSAEWVNESISVNDATYVSKRPVLEKRAFVSSAVERKLDEVAAKIADDKLKWLFMNCFPNTLDTTVKIKIKDGYPDTFVITGDINAMWLRDSSAQVQSYLSLAAEDEGLKEMIKGLINRQETNTHGHCSCYWPPAQEETATSRRKKNKASPLHCPNRRVQ